MLEEYAMQKEFTVNIYMKSIKEYLSEGLIRKQLGNGVRAKIEEWLKEYNIGGCTINDDLTIDCAWSVNLIDYPEKELPPYIQFNVVQRDFDISRAKITTLRGCPKKCTNFWCIHCKSLASLEGAPEQCISFTCRGCKGNFTEEDIRKVSDVKNMRWKKI